MIRTYQPEFAVTRISVFWPRKAFIRVHHFNRRQIHFPPAFVYLQALKLLTPQPGFLRAIFVFGYLSPNMAMYDFKICRSSFSTPL